MWTLPASLLHRGNHFSVGRATVYGYIAPTYEDCQLACETRGMLFAGLHIFT